MARVFAALAVCAVALTAPTPASAQFVQRSGAGLTLNGSPWKFLGYNNYQLTSDRMDTACNRVLSDSTVEAVFSDAKEAGATVVRTWFFQSYYFRAGDSYAPFDRVLAKAAEKGLKVIPVLVNHFPHCEPSEGKSKDPEFYEKDFRVAKWGYPQAYKDWAYQIAAHYRTNTTIAFWQLINEAETSSNGQCDRTVEANGRSRSSNLLRSFADEMAAHVKAADSNHLVSLGTIGSGQCGAEGAEYQYVHAGGVDMCEYHDYNDVTQAIPDDGFNRLRQRIDQCNALNKPFVIGEAGIPADVGPQGQSLGSIDATTLQRRANFFDAKIRAAFNEGIDGYLIWEKIPEASNSLVNFNEGRFGVGPSSLFFDPVNDLTCARARELGIGPLSLIMMLDVNQRALRPGDTLSLTLTTRIGACTSQAVADLYLALLVSGGAVYVFDGTSWMLVFDGVRLFRGALKPLRGNATVANTDETILNGVIPGSIPPGTYTFAAVPVRVGADPINTANWLSAPGQAILDVQLSQGFPLLEISQTFGVAEWQGNEAGTAVPHKEGT